MPARRWIGSYSNRSIAPTGLELNSVSIEDQPQLSVAEHPDDVLMPFDEALQLMTRERLRRPADRPDVAVVLPLVHQVDVARLHGPQAEGAALDVQYNPKI